MKNDEFLQEIIIYEMANSAMHKLLIFFSTKEIAAEYVAQKITNKYKRYNALKYEIERSLPA